MSKTASLESKLKEVSATVKKYGQVEAAHRYGISRSTFRDFLVKHNLPTQKEKIQIDPHIEKPKLRLNENKAEVVTEATAEGLSDPEKIIEEKGLDLKQWELTGVVVNEWDSPSGDRLEQLKIHLSRKTPLNLVLPARIDGPSFKPKKKKIDKDGSLFVFAGDPQAPFHDRELTDKFYQFLDQTNPHTIVNIGDTMDFPIISKYKNNPEHDKIATVQDCVNGGYELLHNERQAAPDARIVKIIGNHDIRLRDFVVEWVPELFGLKRAEIDKPEPSIFSPEFLLRLDELGIECIDPGGESYEHSEFKVSQYLAARHGWIAVKGSGTSALKTLEKLMYSIIVGHTHRLSLVHKTVHDIDGRPVVLAAAESGCLCEVNKKGLGFDPSPDWQQGFATATVWPDGKFKIDLANYVDGDLLWRDQRI